MLTDYAIGFLVSIALGMCAGFVVTRFGKAEAWPELRKSSRPIRKRSKNSKSAKPRPSSVTSKRRGT